MNNQCPLCGNQLKLVPSGFSKSTGRPYQAFWACTDPTRQCKYTAKVEAQGRTLEAMNNIQRQSNDEKDRIKSEGMVRHGVSLKAIDAGMELNPTTHAWIKKWTDYIMSGQLLSTPHSQAREDELNVEEIPF